MAENSMRTYFLGVRAQALGATASPSSTRMPLRGAGLADEPHRRQWPG